MNDLFFNVATCLGSFLAMLGAVIQLGLDLGGRQSYMRTVRTLDKAGVDAAKERRFSVGYRHPEELAWIPRETHEWLESRSPNMVGWAAVAGGAYFLFWGSLAPFAGESSDISTLLASMGGLVALMVAVLIFGVVTAGKSRPGRLRAKKEWRAGHPEQELPHDPDGEFDSKLERWHDRLFPDTGICQGG
ncbi:MAG: hypothetical protein L0J57_05820 [Brachybacterium sp.]|nr:hypothetical protein [Kocuria sp.]MDN6302545.1 hypothetical protein [Brachybacterium sp.]